jgi:hypothetical protein
MRAEELKEDRIPFRNYLLGWKHRGVLFDDFYDRGRLDIVLSAHSGALLNEVSYFSHQNNHVSQSFTCAFTCVLKNSDFKNLQKH